MSRFYASIQGSRGMATRQGHTKTGITGHVRGWNSGVQVYGHDEDGMDVFDITASSGSNGMGASRYIGRVVVDKDGNPTFKAAR